METGGVTGPMFPLCCDMQAIVRLRAIG